MGPSPRIEVQWSEPGEHPVDHAEQQHGHRHAARPASRSGTGLPARGEAKATTTRSVVQHALAVGGFQERTSSSARGGRSGAVAYFVHEADDQAAQARLGVELSASISAMMALQPADMRLGDLHAAARTCRGSSGTERGWTGRRPRRLVHRGGRIAAPREQAACMGGSAGRLVCRTGPGSGCVRSGVMSRRASRQGGTRSALVEGQHDPGDSGCAWRVSTKPPATSVGPRGEIAVHAHLAVGHAGRGRCIRPRTCRNTARPCRRRRPAVQDAGRSWWNTMSRRRPSRTSRIA